MNKEVHSIIRNLQNTTAGSPWYGRPVYDILGDTEPSRAAIKPNNDGHSILELLYHMLTWAEFTLKSIEDDGADTSSIEKMDWREIDPAIYSWEKGLADLKSIHDKIILILDKKNDEFLEDPVSRRTYNVRFLLNGLIQHNIYHVGQVAYINKFLV